MRDYLREQGNFDINGARDASREAFTLDLIQDGDVWMDMIKDRDRTSDAYNKATADMIAKNIIERYFPAYISLRKTIERLSHGS